MMKGLDIRVKVIGCLVLVVGIIILVRLYYMPYWYKNNHTSKPEPCVYRLK